MDIHTHITNGQNNVLTKILGHTPEPFHVTAQMLLTTFTDLVLSEMGTVHKSPTQTFNQWREKKGANVCRWMTDSSKCYILQVPM